jgi:pimeloyl-ACP methyl ester carboxylesterase
MSDLVEAAGPPPRLHVEDRGVGPTLVFSHGFGGSARNFRPQVRAFSDRFRVKSYDARGHARSEAPLSPEAYDFERLVDDYERVAGEGEPVVAAGLSLGAATALGFARRRPERVKALVLASLPRSGQALGGWALRFAEAIDERGLEQAGAEFVWGERSRFDPDGAALIKKGLMEHPPHALAAILRRTLAVLPKVTEIAQGVDLPTLIVVGGDDATALPPSEALKGALPRAELELVPGAGHVVNLVAPDAFNAIVARFLATGS